MSQLFKGDWVSLVKGSEPDGDILRMDFVDPSDPQSFFVKRENAVKNLRHKIDGNNIFFVEAGTIAGQVNIYSGQLVADVPVPGGRRRGVIRGRRITISGVISPDENTATLDLTGMILGAIVATASSDDWTSTRPPGT